MLDAECVKMLHKMFDSLNVPYHRAPGEAEAECARLQQLNVVDAVWSDDSDCLMFGCTTLIMAHRSSSGKKDWDRIQLYRSDILLPRFDFDTDSLVMFAVLAGGDYDDKGLRGCGPQTARMVVQRKHGLARRLVVSAERAQLESWRDMLSVVLANSGSGLSIPADFPNLKALNGYRNPVVSPDEQCRNLRLLRGGWEWRERQMDQSKLRDVLRDHYNFSTRDYLTHLAPVMLARKLSRDVTPARREENRSYGILLRRTRSRKAKDGTDLGVPAQVNIKFHAALVVDIDLSTEPPGEDWSSTVKNDGVPYDPTKPLDSVMLSCFLTHGLPEGALDKSQPSPNKKQRDDDDAAEDLETPTLTPHHGPPQSSRTSSSRKPRKQPLSMDSEAMGNVGDTDPSRPLTSKKRIRKTTDGTRQGKPVKKSRKSQTSEVAAPPSPPARFRRLETPDFGSLRTINIIDLEDDDDSDEEEISSVQDTKTPRPCQWHSSLAPQMVDERAAVSAASASNSTSTCIISHARDDSAGASTLRQKRERGLLSKLSAAKASNPPAMRGACPPPHQEVIVLD